MFNDRSFLLRLSVCDSSNYCYRHRKCMGYCYGLGDFGHRSPKNKVL